MGQPPYTSAYPAAAPGSSSFPPPPLPQSSSSFLSLPVPDSSDVSDPSVPAIDYPPILSSSPTLPPSTTSPSLQQTSFTYPILTPPPSISPANPEMISPHHTPTDTSFSTPGLQDHMPALSLLAQPDQPLQVEPIASGNNSPHDQNSPVFTYPNIPDPAPPQPLLNQNHPPVVSNPAPFLPCSLPNHSAPPSFSFPSVPPPIQNLSFPNMSSSPAHPALHVQNLSQAQAAGFPPSSFTHPSSSLPHPPFQPSSCSAVSSGSLPSFQSSVSSPTAHHQNLTSAPCSYPSVELGAIPQFNPGAPYLPEMMLHHHPSLLPQLDPYPAFSSYPLRLCQDPRSSLPIPLRHLYRQHQHGHPHPHPQGSYLDMSARVGNVYC